MPRPATTQPTCSRCTCNGRGTCPTCAAIKAAVAREAVPPAQRRGIRPAR